MQSSPPLYYLAFAAASLAAACSAPSATSAADGSGLPPASAAPEGARGAPAQPTAAPTLAASASAAPAPLPAPPALASASADASAAPAPSAAAEAPPPAVKVENIGMHIGGGPNDAVTKEPIRRSVEPHFDAFRRCFAKAEDPKKGGDFGIDLRVDKAGGKARVSHPRTALKGKDFEACVVHVFEEVDFLKPRRGTTVVSYSLRFSP